jgi:hypothetical protein
LVSKQSYNTLKGLVMSNVLCEQQRRQLHEKLDQVLDRLPAGLGKSEEAEQTLKQGMRQLGGQALQAWADSANTASAAPECPQCSRRMRHRGLARCRVETTFGTITYRRPRRRCDVCDEELYPHDAQLRFALHGVSWPLARIVSRQMALVPGEQVRSLLVEDYGVELSKETIQQIAYDAGEMLLQQRDVERQAFFSLPPAEQVDAWPPSQCRQPPRVVAVYGDGAKMHAEGEWREIRVGRVRSVDDDNQLMVQNTFARFLSVEEFGQQLALEAYRVGYGQAERRVFLGDGAHWLWELASLLFAEAVPILDWYHLSENVHKAAREVFGEGTDEAKAWVEDRLSELWAGNHRQTRSELAALRKRLRSPSKREALRKLGVYLKHNAGRIDYPAYRAAGLPIGSGPVESACKSLVGARCKQSGMRNWQRRNAEAVLSLRAALQDNTFNGHWSAHLGQAT